jgi:hypothetical protein
MAGNSVFKLFGTNKDLEKTGVWVTYPDVRFKVARVGGSNSSYGELLKQKIRPVRHQVEKDLLSPEKDLQIRIETFAEAIVKRVQVRMNDPSEEVAEWQDGLPVEDGDPSPVTVVGLITLFRQLPDLFNDLSKQANDASKFQKNEEEEDAKNSNQS